MGGTIREKLNKKAYDVHTLIASVSSCGSLEVWAESTRTREKERNCCAGVTRPAVNTLEERAITRRADIMVCGVDMVGYYAIDSTIEKEEEKKEEGRKKQSRNEIFIFVIDCLRRRPSNLELRSERMQLSHGIQPD